MRLLRSERSERKGREKRKREKGGRRLRWRECEEEGNKMRALSLAKEEGESNGKSAADAFL